MMALRWHELAPEPGVLGALDHAGPRPAPDASQSAKRRWSERFAHACAVTVADAFRPCGLDDKTIRPVSIAGGTEPLTPLGGATRKRIDVTVVDSMLGLEIGVSLKGLNFRDAGSGNFDKNLTGRLYEMADEVRVVHEHLPHAFIAGIFFLPLEATIDKTDSATSSFAHTVRKLRERTGRLDPALAAQASRCDAGFVSLYAHEEGRPIRRGVARFFPVTAAPPRRGRPVVAQTLALGEMVQAIVDSARYRDPILWGEAEVDHD